MKGFNPVTGELFCDLHCSDCKGSRHDVCLIVGQKTGMFYASMLCVGHGLLVDYKKEPKGFWEKNDILSEESMPELADFPDYAKETLN